MSHLRRGVRCARRLSILCVVLVSSVLPGSASAQGTTPSPTTGASASIRQLGTTPAYPYTARPLNPNGRSMAAYELQKVNGVSGEAVAQRVLIQVSPNTGPADLASISRTAAARGAGVAAPVMQLVGNRYLVDVTGAVSVEDAAKAYRNADPRVLGASPDKVGHVDTEFTNDSLGNLQTNLNQIKVRDAWDRSHGDFTRIAILDTGIAESHQDLVGKVDGRTETLWAFHTTNDLHGHGTGMAGLAAAATNNELGIAGVGYNARLLNVKVADDFGSHSTSSVASGIYWAVDHGASVINLSLSGGDDCNPSWFEDWLDVGRAYLRDAIDYAWSHNVVVVAGAGNAGNNSQRWPAACPHVLSVANITPTNNRAPTSSYGDWVHVAARGEGVFSTTLPGAPGGCQLDIIDQYGKCGGTSAASAQVSGVVALVQSSCLPMSAQAVIDRITSTSDPIHAGEGLWQFGRVNAVQAVCLSQPTGLAVTSATDASISFAWHDRSRLELSFEFHSRPIGGAWQSVTLPPDTSTYTATGLTPMQRYEFRVRACDFFGCSEWTNTVTAVPNAHRLTTLRTGYGRITSSPAGINCLPTPSQCNAFFTHNTVVYLTPFPMWNPNTHDEYEFDHWEDACAGAGYVCQLTVDQAKTARAVFKKIGNSGP